MKSQERRTEGDPGRRRCPECLGDLPPNPETAAALLDHGCVYCGAEIAAGALDAPQ